MVMSLSGASSPVVSPFLDGMTLPLGEGAALSGREGDNVPEIINASK